MKSEVFTDSKYITLVQKINSCEPVSSNYSNTNAIYSVDAQTSDFRCECSLKPCSHVPTPKFGPKFGLLNFTLCQWWRAEIQAEWVWNSFIRNFGPNFDNSICCCTYQAEFKINSVSVRVNKDWIRRFECRNVMWPVVYCVSTDNYNEELFLFSQSPKFNVAHVK